MSQVKSDRYAAAGVDIDRAGELMEHVKEKIGAATRREVLAPVGGFGGLLQLDLSRWREPVLVSSIDGVGTKLIVAGMMQKHDSVGHDIVNDCINDVIVQGAEPLYFLDYLGIGKLRSPLYEEVLGGVAEACAAQNVALLGGETAEMPGVYSDEYDLVGCITGVAEKSRLVSGDTIEPGHAILGLASNGLHTNGYSLARQVLFGEAGFDAHTTLPELDGASVGEALLKPHVCYWPVVRDLLTEEVPLYGMAHITGGGLYDNVPRILPAGVDAVFDLGKVSVPPIFEVIRDRGGIDAAEMYRVFNMGVGMALFLPEAALEQATEMAYRHGIPACRVGEVQAGDGGVTIAGVDAAGGASA